MIEGSPPGHRPDHELCAHFTFWTWSPLSTSQALPTSSSIYWQGPRVAFSGSFYRWLPDEELDPTDKGKCAARHVFLIERETHTLGLTSNLETSHPGVCVCVCVDLSLKQHTKSGVRDQIETHTHTENCSFFFIIIIVLVYDFSLTRESVCWFVIVVVCRCNCREALRHLSSCIYLLNAFIGWRRIHRHMEFKNLFMSVLALCLFFLPLLEALSQADQPKLVKTSYVVKLLQQPLPSPNFNWIETFILKQDIAITHHHPYISITK